jgi:hypothetical protein
LKLSRKIWRSWGDDATEVSNYFNRDENDRRYSALYDKWSKTNNQLVESQKESIKLKSQLEERAVQMNVLMETVETLQVFQHEMPLIFKEASQVAKDQQIVNLATQLTFSKANEFNLVNFSLNFLKLLGEKDYSLATFSHTTSNRWDSKSGGSFAGKKAIGGKS